MSLDDPVLHAPPWPERAGRDGDTQPLPTPNDRSDIQSMVTADIETRRQVGIRRYGTALQAHNGRDGPRRLAGLRRPMEATVRTARAAARRARTEPC